MISISKYLTGNRFILIAGPCVVESEDICYEIAEELRSICLEYSVSFIFKASFSKANRTKLNSFRGIDFNKALGILSSIREKYNVPVLTDIHESHQAQIVADHVDIIQIPAFLSRQTFLLEAAAATGKAINIKKGEFMTSETLKYQAEKVRNINSNTTLFLTERGTTFGKNDVVIDFREVVELNKDIPNSFSIVDCSHTVQRVNLSDGVSAGNRKYSPFLAKAAIAVGANGIFMETHPNPDKALSDSSSTYSLKEMKILLNQLSAVWDAVH